MSKRKCFLSCVVLALSTSTAVVAYAAPASAIGPAEKTNLKLGFIKLTDMAPLAIAYEKGYFRDEGLNVQLEAQSNWKVLYDRVSGGELDGAHMLAAMPMGSITGITGTKAIIAPFTMSYNGAGITVSNEVWAKMKPLVPKDGTKPKHPISAAALKPMLLEYKAKGKPINMGMTFPVGTHNYMMRYWLAAGGVNPGFYDPKSGNNTGNKGADVLLSVVPPPQMVATMDANTTEGFCVGEPWNQQAVAKGIGVPVMTSDVMWSNGSDKVFGITEDFSKKNPNTTIHLVKALIRANQWLDASPANRIEASKIISKSNYVGADSKIIDNSMTGTFEFEKGDVRAAPNFNRFYKGVYGAPYYSDAVWWLTQMRRWGQIADSKPDAWYLTTAKRAFRPDLFSQAANALIAEGKISTKQMLPLAGASFIKAPQKGALDGIVFDGKRPNAYLKSFAIGYK